MKLLGFKNELEKLQKNMWVLESDRDKYCVEASKANKNYYQSLEQVKLKNNLITRLQRKNIEAEGRLKQQQNLYEAVRSDRQLFSKNLLEAQDEIAELKMKYKLLSQQLSQLKEEISTKDKQHQADDKQKKGIRKENNILEKNKEDIQKQINSSDQMIKTQESDISRLKYVITEAEAEKQKQRKDYEMVINERDILGT